MIESISARIAAIQAKISPTTIPQTTPGTNSGANSAPANFEALLAQASANPLATGSATGTYPAASAGSIEQMLAGRLGIGGSSAMTSSTGFMTRPASGSSVAGVFALSGDADARRQQLAPAFSESGRRHGVDPALLEAVAWTESNFTPSAVSHAGAQGLMQIMPGTAAELGIDPSDPAQAIEGAAMYLRQQMDRFGDPRLALAAYNAGPGAVQSHGGIPPYPETTAYVDNVLSRYQVLSGANR